ncbi:MAG: hypothetical protein ACEPOZ_13600 [Marinifilaceae bacterium]
MEPILLKPQISNETLDELIRKGVNDLDIPQEQKTAIHEQAMRIAPPFVRIIQTHITKGKEPDEDYTIQIASEFQTFTKAYHSLFREILPQDIIICFGMSSIWMGILNGLDAETGILPNHPFKREIATCLRTISDILETR